MAYAVYAGYIILTSAGNEDQIEKGTSTLKTATIGIIIALSSYAIVTFVSRSLLEAGEEPQPGWQIEIDTRSRDLEGRPQDPRGGWDNPFIPSAIGGE